MSVADPWSDPNVTPPVWPGVRQHTGSVDGRGLRLAMVVSRYNLRFTAELLRGAVDRLLELGTSPNDIHVTWVPGAYEIPAIADMLAASGMYHAILALGCVIRGETPHADLINHTVAVALSDISRKYRCPVVDAVVPAFNEAQAAARCTGPGNRGVYAATVGVYMARLMAELRMMER